MSTTVNGAYPNVTTFVDKIVNFVLYIKKTASPKMTSGENVKGKTSKMAIFSKNVFLRVE